MKKTNLEDLANILFTMIVYHILCLFVATCLYTWNDTAKRATIMFQKRQHYNIPET